MVRAVFATDSGGNVQSYNTINAARQALGVSATAVSVAAQNGRTVKGWRLSYDAPLPVSAPIQPAAVADTAIADTGNSDTGSDVTMALAAPVNQSPTSFVATAGDLGHQLVRSYHLHESRRVPGCHCHVHCLRQTVA